MQSVFITGADRGLGLSLCKEFLSRQWRVFAGKYREDYSLLECLQQENKNLFIIRIDVGDADSITKAVQEIAEISSRLDMLISNAALMGKVNCKINEPPMDLESVWRLFNVNALGPLRLTNAVLPLMQGGLKRLCYVSSEVSSINLMKFRHSDSFPYPMSKAAMNMGIRLLFNALYPIGYTFRLFHPGWMKFRLPDGSLTDEGKFDPDFIGEYAAKYFEKSLYDENRLVMLDYNGYEWPF